MKINVNKTRYLGIIMFCFFFLTVDFRTKIFHGVFGAYLFAIIGIFFLLKDSKTRLLLHCNYIIVVWIASILFVLTSGDVSLIIKYTMGLVVLYCFATTKGSSEATIRVIFFFGIIFATFSILFAVFPQLYIENVVPFLEDYLQDRAITMINSQRYPGLTGHYSTNGIYLSFGFGAGFSIYLSSSDKMKKKYVLLFLILFFVALLLIGKRAHLVFSTCSCFLIYWISNERRKNNRLIKSMGIIIILVLVTTLLVIFVPALSNTLHRFVMADDSGDFMMSRSLFFRRAIDIFNSSPLIGIGWRKIIHIYGNDVHNIYLQLLAETGIIGFLVYVYLLGYGAIESLKLFKYFSKYRRQILVCDYCIMAYVTYYIWFFVIYGLTGNPLYDEQTFYMLMISFGLLIFMKKNKKIIVSNIYLK